MGLLITNVLSLGLLVELQYQFNLLLKLKMVLNMNVLLDGIAEFFKGKFDI